MRSIACRLVIRNTITFALILIFCGATTLLMSINYLRIKATLETKEAIKTVHNITVHQNMLTPHTLLHTLERNNIKIQIITSGGKVLEGSHGLRKTVLTPVYQGPPVFLKMQGHHIFRAGTQLSNGNIIQIVRPLTMEENFIQTFAVAFGCVAFIGLFLSIIGGCVITRAALNPIQKLTQTAISAIPFDRLAVEIVREAQSTAKDLTIYLKTLEPVTAEVDEYYLRRVLWIVVDNAMKYNHPGVKWPLTFSKTVTGKLFYRCGNSGARTPQDF